METSTVSKTISDFTPRVEGGQLKGLRYNLAQPNILYAIVWMNQSSSRAMNRLIPDVRAQMSQRPVQTQQQQYQFIFMNTDASVNRTFALRNSIQVPGIWRLDATEGWTFTTYDVSAYDATDLTNFLLEPLNVTLL